MVQYRRQGKEKMDDPLRRWLAWFDKRTPAKLLEEVVKMDEAIQTANERMVYVTGDKEAIRAYEMRLLGRMDRINELLYAHDEGHDEAMKSVARNALATGLSVEYIHDITGLDIETIQTLNRV